MIYKNWWRKEGHKLHLDDLNWVLDKNPTVLIVGKGKYGVLSVTKEVKNELRSREIELIESKSDEACQIFNRRVDSEDLAIAIHLTC